MEVQAEQARGSGEQTSAGRSERREPGSRTASPRSREYHVSSQKASEMLEAPGAMVSLRYHWRPVVLWPGSPFPPWIMMPRTST